jgi:hypothetical protein
LIKTNVKEDDRKPSSQDRMLKQTVENVLVLQGGGSLGAFACGVMKAFVKKDITLQLRRLRRKRLVKEGNVHYSLAYALGWTPELLYHNHNNFLGQNIFYRSDSALVFRALFIA